MMYEILGKMSSSYRYFRFSEILFPCVSQECDTLIADEEMNF